jgi:hypothetical protein
MADAYLIWGSDLSFTASNDLQLATGSEAGRQRVIRRLLTNPGDYLAHPTYGAGLPLKVGSISTPAELQALVLSQMLMESVVAQDPPPVVTTTQITNGVAILVQYTDANNSDLVTISFDVNQ